MQITKLNHLAAIKITYQNCDEIIAESTELMKMAMSIKFEAMKSEALSRQIKRGIAAKREREIKMEANQ